MVMGSFLVNAGANIKAWFGSRERTRAAKPSIQVGRDRRDPESELSSCKVRHLCRRAV